MANLELLNRQLATLKQLFQKLTGMLPRTDWGQISTLDDNKRKQVGVLAFVISNRIEAIGALLAEIHWAGTPFVTPTSQVTYFENEIQPYKDAIDELCLEALGLIGNDREVTNDEELDGTKQKDPRYSRDSIDDIDSLIASGVDFLKDTEFVESGPLVDDATYQRTRTLVNSKFFQADKWYQNLECMRPIVVNEKVVPKLVKPRIREVQEAFIVGHYLSVLILCRAVLEYVLFDRAAQYGIESLSYKDEPRRLSELVSEYSERVPTIEIEMWLIKRLADSAVHMRPGPKKGIVAYPEVTRANALRSWEALKTILETVYRKNDFAFEI